MPRFRQAAAVIAVFGAGIGVAACSDRQNASQGNGGGDPVGVTSPAPQDTGGTGTGTSAPPPSATNTVGTLPSQPTDPQTKTDNPQPAGGTLGDAGAGGG